MGDTQGEPFGIGWVNLHSVLQITINTVSLKYIQGFELIIRTRIHYIMTEDNVRIASSKILR